MKTLKLDIKTAMLKTALQEAIDNIEMLRYLRLGALDVPAYIKQAAELAIDKQQLDNQTVENFFESMEQIERFNPNLN